MGGSLTATETTMELSNEQQWLEAYRSGDVEALGMLVEHTRRPLYAFILRLTSVQEAEEVFQEVWLRAVKNMDRYENRNRSILSWLFRIARNHVIDRSRKKRPDANLEDRSPGRSDSEGGTWYDRLPVSGLRPDAIVAGHDLGTRIAEAVETLPTEQREVFLMRTEGLLPFKEIASIQDTSINTSLARMHYALAKLRDYLSDDFDAFTMSQAPSS